MVLGRIVSQEDYGLIALILAVPALLSAFGDFGISRSIASNPDLPEHEVRDTALVLMLIQASLLGLLALGSGWYYDQACGDPRLRWVGLIAAVTYAVQAVQSVQLAMLQRDLKFARWAGIEWLTTFITVACGVGIALAGGGVFALSVQQLLPQIVGLAITLRAKPVAWPRRFQRTTAGAFYSFGWRTSLYQYANNVQGSLAALLIGWPGGLQGPALVGQFNKGTQVRDLLGQNLLSTFDLVLSPLLARSRDDRERLRDLYLRGTIGVTAFTVFSAAWLMVVASDLVRVFLGVNWPEVPPIVVALAPGMAIGGIGYTGLLVALALKRPLVNFVAALATLLGLLVAGAVYLWTKDLPTFAAVQSAVVVIPSLGMARWASHACGTTLRHLLTRLAPVFLFATVTFGVGLAVQWACGSWDAIGLVGNIARLAVVSLVGLAVGGSLVYFGSRSTYDSLVGLMLRRPIDAVTG